MGYTQADIIRLVKEDDVEFIRLQFTDIFGTLKNTAITKSQLIKALNGECAFDGSSIEGFARIEESEMYLMPDLDTFAIFPWRPQQGKVARFICDIRKVDGTPYEADCRNILKNVLKEASDRGYKFVVGPEIEFFLFNLDERGLPTTYSNEKAGYFDIGPADQGENARRDMVLTLEEMGFEVESSHHELAPAQHEIDFMYDEALNTADNIQTFKMAVKTVAKRHGLHATFMPKPVEGAGGSGMHLNIACKKNDENVFFDFTDKNRLSAEGYYFMGGIMKHIDAITAVTNPLVNSYKRLVPGYEAPVYVAWSQINRSPLIRVPICRHGDARIELRFPDPSANPYLALAAIIKAGLDGIENKTEPPARVDQNIFDMTDAQREELGIRALPDSLESAVNALEEDKIIRGVLGEPIASKYIETKRKEYSSFRACVSQWEIDRYLANH